MFVKYQLSPKAVERLFIETGTKPPLVQHVEIDVTALSPEQRQQIVALGWSEFIGSGAGRTSFGGPALQTMIIHDHHGTMPPAITGLTREFDDYITAEIALEAIAEMVATKAALEAELPARVAAYETEREARKAELQRFSAERSARLEAEKLAKREVAEAKRQARMTIPWNASGKAVCDLFDAVRATADIEMDNRFSGNWIKRVTAVDTAKENGFAFEGAFIHRGTVEIEKEPVVFIVAGTSGSRKHNKTDYVVVTMSADGVLAQTGITTDDDLPGWALRIRDQVAALFQK